MKILSKDDVLDLHYQLINETGGSSGLRDEGGLESALYSAHQTFDGEDLYPTVLEKIARITYSLIMNHPFIDGNKRIGMYVMVILLDLNGLDVVFSNKEIENIGLSIASGSMSDKNLIDLLRNMYVT